MEFALSSEWLKEFVNVRHSPEKLAERLSLHSVSVEHIRRMDAGLDAKVVVGRVVKMESHPNADKLNVAYVIVRSSAIRVVCGGTNLREGMLVAYAPAGARVRWHGEGEVAVLQPTEIRGVRSDGMICAASEIGLGTCFTNGEREILDLSFLDFGNLKFQNSNPIGTPLAVALGLDDAILDCEITTNRPDLMSVEGLAREVSVVTNAKLRVPSSRRSIAPVRGVPAMRVRIADRNDCPRYGAVVIDGATVAPSPWWMQRRLLAAGLRPIHNVVDVTNYVMLELGQPLHVFDAAKVRGGISIRRARAGESLTTLDGAARMLTSEMLIIADDERPLALAGIIGGQETGATERTTRVIIECANFDPMVIRRGARASGVRTDASLRFEKGLRPEAIPVALTRATELLCAVSGGIPGKPTIVGASPKPPRPIAFSSASAASRIGVAIPPAYMRRTLTALGCVVTKMASGTLRRKKVPGTIFSVTLPWWRRGDLEQSHDLTEEIARLYGYHRLPALLPAGTLPAAVRAPEPPTTAFAWECRARAALIGAGGVEIVPFTLTSRAAIERCGYALDQAVVIENPLSEEFAVLRPSLIPTLLPLIARNQEHAPNGVLFELGNVYIPTDFKFQISNFKSPRKHDAGLPREEMRLLIGAYGRMVSGGHVLQLKGVVEHLFDRLGVAQTEFRRSEQCELPSGVCLWHPGRTMDVVVGSTLIGTLGEIHPAIVERWSIGQRVAVAELDWAPILAACRAARPAHAPPAHPSVKRDIAFIVDRKIAYANIAAVLTAFDPLLEEFALFDTFEGAGVPMGKKSLAFHLTYRVSDRTLTGQEGDAIHARLIQTLRERFAAEIRE